MGWRSVCTVMLVAFGLIGFSSVGPTFQAQACGIAHPVKLGQISGVQLTPKAHIDRDLAKIVAHWFDKHVQPAARAHFGQNIKAIKVAASYACRTRNSQKGAKISEHGYGRALDVGAFQLNNGTWVQVKFHPTGSAAARFQKAVRAGACGPFSTVLGPGSDKYHKDHLHLDMAPRRSKSAYCR